MPELTFAPMSRADRARYGLSTKKGRDARIAKAQVALELLMESRARDIAAIDPRLSPAGQADERIRVGNRYDLRIENAERELAGWKKGAIEAALGELPDVQGEAARAVVSPAEIEQRAARISQALTSERARTVVPAPGGGVTEATPNVPGLALELGQMFAAAGDEAGLIALAQHEGLGSDLASIAGSDGSGAFEAKRARQAISEGVAFLEDARTAPVRELRDEIDSRQAEYIRETPDLFVVERNESGVETAVQGIRVPSDFGVGV